jgi:hypothetical protein
MRDCQAVLAAAAMMLACAGLRAPLAHAQEDVAPGSDTYGTASTVDHVLQAYAFEHHSDNGQVSIATGFRSRGCTGTCTFVGPAMLPAGAVIEAMQLEACDTNAAGSVTATLTRQVQLESAIVTLAGVTTSVNGTPGCAFFTAFVTPPHTVNNDDGTYAAEVFMTGGSLSTRFQAVRVVYRLQVSPAPGTATFPNDVPASHPFFRFVEALAAAGITGGCSAGSYCPDSPVTRGQMAVFLATALGLHFPN